jgi:drug/metabolite transporter (DMT)-like permease
MPAAARPRSSLPATSAGTSTRAFVPVDWGLLAVVALGWGSSFSFIAIGLGSFAPGVVTMARIGLAAAVLALSARARAPVARDDLGRIALLGAAWVAIPYTLYPIAQQWIDSSVAGMINGAMPIFAALWATLLLRRPPGWRQVLGIAVGFVGIVLVFVPELQSGSSAAGGALVALLAVSFFGLGVNLAVPLQQKYGALPVILRAQVAAFVMVLPLGLLGIPASTWAWDAALAMLPLGIFGTGIAYVAMATLAGRVGGSRAAVTIYFVPLVAIVLGVVLLGESVALSAIVGVALVLVGAVSASRRER